MPAYPELQPNVLTFENVHFIDIQSGVSYINSQGFDVFFLGCAQNGRWHPELTKLNCKTIIVFHEQGREYMMLCEICPRCGLIDKIISITGEEYVRKS